MPNATWPRWVGWRVRPREQLSPIRGRTPGGRRDAGAGLAGRRPATRARPRRLPRPGDRRAPSRRRDARPGRHGGAVGGGGRRRADGGGQRRRRRPSRSVAVRARPAGAHPTDRVIQGGSDSRSTDRRSAWVCPTGSWPITRTRWPTCSPRSWRPGRVRGVRPPGAATAIPTTRRSAGPPPRPRGAPAPSSSNIRCGCGTGPVPVIPRCRGTGPRRSR